jgi:SMI1 / KNR4 family (SUKH-1)
MLGGCIFRHATAERVAAFEKENGIVFPDDYRTFLMTDARHPGTAVKSGEAEYSMPNLKIYSRVEFGWFGDFFCIGADVPWLELSSVPFLADVPGSHAIANDDDGRPWILSVIEPDFGHVYFGYRHDDCLVAQSFTEFLAMVEPPNASEVIEQQIREETGPLPFRYPPAEYWESRPRDPDSPPENVMAPKRWWEILLRR